MNLGICLRRAGKANVPAALWTHQDIRYERVKAVQKTGETTRDRWHKTDWEAVRKDPKSVAFPREDWIHKHDAEAHAEEVFDDVFRRRLAAGLGKTAAGNGSGSLIKDQQAAAVPVSVVT